MGPRFADYKRVTRFIRNLSSSTMTAHKHAHAPAAAAAAIPDKGEFWTANAIFFVAMHAIAVAAFWIKPASSLPRATLLMLPLLWQAAVFGCVCMSLDFCLADAPVL